MAKDIVEEKLCVDCMTPKPIGEFYVASYYKDVQYRQPYCILCSRKRKKRWCFYNPEGYQRQINRMAERREAKLDRAAS
jgi:hypothetical protein